MPEIRREPVPEGGRMVERERVVETPTEARAAVPVKGMRSVLFIGTGSVIVLFAIVFMVFFG